MVGTLHTSDGDDGTGELPSSVLEAAEEVERSAHQGSISERHVDRLVTRLNVPAIHYRDLIGLLGSRGVEVVREEEDEPLDADADQTAARPRAPTRPSSGQHDGLGHLLRVSRQHGLLTAEEERDLSKKVQAGMRAAEHLEAHGDELTPEQRAKFRATVRRGQEAMDRFVTCNIRLVVWQAKRYMGAMDRLRMEFDDVVQEGILGLIRAVEKFDWSMGHKFSTYATWWIRQATSRGIANQGLIVRLPVHVKDKLYKLRKFAGRLEARGETVTVGAVAEHLDVDEERARDLIALAANSGTDSLNRLVSEDGTELGELVGGPAEAVETEVMRALGSELIREALEDLTPRERTIIEMRFGLVDGEERTLEEIGDHFGLTRERIRQIQNKAIVKLRHPAVAEELRAALL